MHPTNIGPFRIERELGRGGMGEVFLATDSRLDRQVAVKSLPAHLSQEADRLARFQREAKVLASLNHPNIGGIHGLEESEGRQYLILEYIEGETLAERLTRGPIPLDDSLAIAKQITEALEVAHDKGIVHRDLKPGNVMVTSEGTAKVLDFGLARTSEAPSSSTNAAAMADSPTVTMPAGRGKPVHSPTIPGVIMGSAGYMSPEQARGKVVDRRSDIFSFGCVLFEMLSGEQPFGGETTTDALGAILHREPDWKQLPQTTPPRVRELLTNCLAKDRRNRLHDIGDARLQIEHAIAGHELAPAAAPAGPGRFPVALTAAIAVLTLAMGGAVGALLMRPAPTTPPQPYHVSLTTPPKPEVVNIMGFSPDARFVIYKAWPEFEAGSNTPYGILMVSRLDRSESKPIPGTEGVIEAALSADGRWVAFIAARDRARTRVSLKKIALENGQPAGTPVTLCDLPSSGDSFVCWSSDRDLVIAQSWNQTILTVPASGGEPRVILRDEAAAGVDNWGDIRPLVPGRSVLASRWALSGQSIRERTEVVDLADGKRTPLMDNAGGTQYLPSGHLIARRNANSLIAVRFDLESRKLTGEPVTVWNGSQINGFFVSTGGTLALSTQAGDITGRTLAWIDDKGRLQPIDAPPRAYQGIDVSPDGGRIVTNLQSTEVTELGNDLWVYDLVRRTFNRVPTSGPAWEQEWSPDGQRIAYSSVSKEEFSIWERRADGSGEPEEILAGPTTHLLFPTAWSPDGKTLAVAKVDLAKSTSDLWMLEKDPASGKWTATPYLETPADEGWSAFSPDGKWVRFTSSETGRNELYVQRFTGAKAGPQDARSGRVQISTSGAGGVGWWSPDGKEIRFVDADRQVMSVQVQTEPTITASLPKPLYSTKDLKTWNSNFAPDGRIIAVMKGEDEGKSHIDLIVNFVDEMLAKMPKPN